MLNSGMGETASVPRQDCRPDYETMITNAKANQEKAKNLLNALYHYLGDRHVQDKLAEMIGELVMEIRTYDKAIDRLIAQEESDDRPK